MKGKYLKAFGFTRPPATFFGGKRRWRTRFGTERATRIMKPRMRIVQGKLKDAIEWSENTKDA